MIKYLLDTNICIYIIRQKPRHVVSRLRDFPISEIAISSITLSELDYGVVKSAKPEQNRLALSQFLAPVEIMPYDGNAAFHYGKIRSYLEKRGIPIGSLDMLIAAHACSLDCVLVTNNEAEFRRIPDLKVENWV